MSSQKYTYNDIGFFLRKEGHRYEKLLEAIDDDIIEGRDRTEESVPIYSTKYRLKNKDSLYLKMKRKLKYNKIEDVTDVGGMRILCLFEQDIPEAFDFLMKEVFCVHDRKITECIVYNYDKEHAEIYENRALWRKYQPEFSKKFTKNFQKKKKDSGYKSIHFLLESTIEGAITVEIQLRSLLQDVWGEIEHAMSYKQGQLNLGLSETFKWLQRDLENVDNMMSTFKEYQLKSSKAKAIFDENYGPFSFMDYEKSILPQELIGCSEKLSETVEKYQHICKSRAGPWITEKQKKDISRAYNAVKAHMPNRDPSKKKDLEYWFSMEEAYVDFCQGRRKDAVQAYELICADEAYKNRYVPRFRAGEVYYLENEHTEAFKKFDEAEAILDAQTGQKNSFKRQYNHYLIQSKLALNSWRKGSEYLPLALHHITHAAKIAEGLPEEVRASSLVGTTLTNNLCWFHLDSFHVEWSGGPLSFDLASPDVETKARANVAQAMLQKAEGYYDELSNELSDGAVRSHILDTAAWYCYTKYLLETAEAKGCSSVKNNLGKTSSYGKAQKTELIKLKKEHEGLAIRNLKQALAHVRKMINSDRSAASRLQSLQLQNDHLKEITTEAQKHGLL